MKNNIHGKTLAMFCITLSLLVGMMFGACTIETSDNGDLDGYWHLTQIDTLSTGGVCDKAEERIFWSIQHKLIMARDIEQRAEVHYFRFRQTADTLTLTKAYISHGHQDTGENGGDIPVDTISQDLRFYGIHIMPQSFFKESLSGSRMTLRSDSLRLHFVKF